MIETDQNIHEEGSGHKEDNIVCDVRKSIFKG